MPTHGGTPALKCCQLGKRLRLMDALSRFRGVTKLRFGMPAQGLLLYPRFFQTSRCNRGGFTIILLGRDLPQKSPWAPDTFYSKNRSKKRRTVMNFADCSRLMIWRSLKLPSLLTTPFSRDAGRQISEVPDGCANS